MALAQSKITSQGQISVPLAVRKKLGLVPGETIEWIEKDGEVHVQRATSYSSLDIHEALFEGVAPEAKPQESFKQGIRERMRKKYARD